MFCLVSRQAMANVLPVFMLKPKNVLLLSTAEEKQCANNLEKLFVQKNIKVYRRDNLDAYDYKAFREVVREELKKHGNDVILNLTGGTKLMALAARDAFAEFNRKIVYCDTEHKKLITIHPTYHIEDLNAELTIEDYLRSYGYKIIDEKNINIDEYFKFFNFIEKNNLMSSFVNMYKKVRQKIHMEIPKFTEFNHDKRIKITRDLTRDLKGFFIEYGNSIKEKFFIPHSEFKSGDWLEYYTYYLLSQNKNSQLKLGVKLINENGVENEIDVMELKDYRLLLYSCKSGKKDNQFDLYQIETLRNITSGTFGKGIFVTANKQSAAFLKRAQELSIKVINVLETKPA